MAKPSVLYASRLRERAARCRELARGAGATGITREFETIAQEQEDECDADRLERQANSTRRASSFDTSQ